MAHAWWHIWGEVGERGAKGQAWIGPNAPEDSPFYFRVPEFKALRGKTEYTKPIPLENLPNTPSVTGDLISEYNKTKRTATRKINIEGYGEGRLVANRQYKGKIYFYADEANKAHNQAVAQDLSDINDLQTIFTSLAGPTAALTGTRSTPSHVVLKQPGKTTKVPVSSSGKTLLQQRALNKYKSQFMKVDESLNIANAKNVTPNQSQVSTTPTSGDIKPGIVYNKKGLPVNPGFDTGYKSFVKRGRNVENLPVVRGEKSVEPITMKLSKKQVAANAAAETSIAIPDPKGIIPRSVSPELDFLSKQPQAEQVRRITTQIKAQHESEQLGKKSELLTSAQSLGTGQKVFMESPEVKLAAGLKLEAPGILKKFGHAWNSAVQQAHHWFQKGFTGPFMQHIVKLARDPNSPITFYDVANIEAAIQSTGIPGIGHSGVGGIIESIHNYSHDLDRKLGREPTGGKVLATSEMTPKQLKAEAAKRKKFEKIYKETGKDIEQFYPGPGLGNLLEEAFKLKTADELTQYVIDIANEFYVPQMKRMQKLNEAAEDDLPEFSANVELSRLRRDDTKAIIRGAKPNTLGLTKEQLKARKDKESFEYQEARVAQRESAIEIDKRRDAVKEQKADIAQENLMRGYEPGTPEYKYIEWIHEDELKRIRWRTGGRIQSFGRVR